MEEFESYETTTTLEMTPETRDRIMNDFTNSLSAMLQSGVRMLSIGENLEGNALYFVCADPTLSFVNFLNIEMDDEGNIETHTFEIKNEDFDDLYGLTAPIVIEDCTSFEDFLGKSGITVVPEDE